MLFVAEREKTRTRTRLDERLGERGRAADRETETETEADAETGDTEERESGHTITRPRVSREPHHI